MNNHDLEIDCQKTHDSLGSFRQLIPFLTSLTQLQRQQLRETYEAVYREDLINHLQRNEAGFSSMKAYALSLWLLEPHDRDAVMAYQKRFKRMLDQDIVNLDPPHSFQKILLALAASHKAHQIDISQHISKCDARRLYETGEGSLAGAIEEAVMLEILSKRSIPQLKLTFFSYKHIYGHGYIKSLKRGNFGEFEKTLRLVAKYICNPEKCYAKAVFESMKGRRSSDETLGRVLVSRAEVDMDEIKRAFKEKYRKELPHVIRESISSGDYRDFLLALATRATPSTTAVPYVRKVHSSKTC